MSPARRNVRRIALSRGISLTGSNAAFTALMYTVYRRTDSSTEWLALALLATFGASALVSPIAGALGDRFDRRRVMLASDLSGMAAFGALAFVHAPAIMLSIAFVAAIVEAPFFPASSAAIPNLAGQHELAWANGTVAVGRNLGQLVGPVVGGVLVALVGPGWVFGLNALSFALSAAFVWSVRADFAGSRHDAAGHRGLRAGFVFLWRDRVLAIMTVAWVVWILGVGSVLVAEIPLANLFHTHGWGYGLIQAGWGAGALLGSVLGRRMRARHEPMALVLGCVGTALGFGAVSIVPWFGPVLACMVLAGGSDAITMVAEQGVVQRRTPDAVRSRVVSATEAVITVAFAASFGFGAPLVAAVGPRAAYALAGVGTLTAAAILAAAVRLPRTGRAPAGAPDLAAA